MLRLRPYNKNDAEIIMSWIKGENAFYKWTAGVLGEYPISAEQFNMVSNLMAFTAIDDNEIVGFFTMRRPNEFYEELRFGFVIVDSKKRGQGYGKNMLKLGLKYAKEIFVQFTTPSGLHSVLERPFSEANGRPFLVKRSPLIVC